MFPTATSTSPGIAALTVMAISGWFMATDNKMTPPSAAPRRSRSARTAVLAGAHVTFLASRSASWRTGVTTALTSSVIMVLAGQEQQLGLGLRGPILDDAIRSDLRTHVVRRWFAVHKALDQVGAFAGPLFLAGMAALTGPIWPGLGFCLFPAPFHCYCWPSGAAGAFDGRT